VNDRPDIAVLAGAKGVHVGQDDLDVSQARGIVGTDAWVGVSTHNMEQFRAAAETSADYIAVGPVFETASKANPDPVVGIEFIRETRKITAKPIVAIGGITPERAAEAIAAGADSVAVISDILRADDMAARVRRYLELLGTESSA
jgi:thiamine-phosphate pyrophosphorylase